jgi:hypothetical protein
LLPSGEKLCFTQAKHESRPEFRGRLLCCIEDKIGRPVPAGTLWAEWDSEGHPLRKYYTHGLGCIYRHTGNLFEHRRERVPGLFSEERAKEYMNGPK